MNLAESVAMEPSYIKANHFKKLLEEIPIAHTFTDWHKAREVMGRLLCYHNTKSFEVCNCYVCSVLTAAVDNQWHSWQFCSNYQECVLCSSLVGDMMHILLPEEWPSWAKMGE